MRRSGKVFFAAGFLLILGSLTLLVTSRLGAAKAVELELTDEEISYLEAPYVPHPLAGVMAQNRKPR